jgi:hypothetical protein
VSRSLRSLKVGECLPGRGHCSTGDPIAGLLSRGRERDLPGSQAIHPVPLPRSTTPAEPTIPRLLTVSSMLPPLFPRRRLQRLMNFGALLRGFSTCCLRFKSDVATTHAKLASGRLARLYREGVEPSGSLQKVSDHISRPPFLDLSWRKESFMARPSHFDEATSCSHRAEGAQWLLPGKAAVAADILRRLSVTRSRSGVPREHLFNRLVGDGEHAEVQQLRNGRPIASGVSQCAATAVEVEPSR